MAVQTFFLIAGRMTNSSVFMVGRGSSHKAGPPTAPYSAKILKKKRSRFKSHASLLSKEWFTKVEPLMRPHTSMIFERCALYNLLGTEWNHAVFKFAAHIKEQFSVTLCRKSKSLIGDEDTFTKTTQGSAGALLGLTGLLFSPPPQLILVFHLSLRPGTLTQFILVLYGTSSTTSSSSEKSQPGNDSCKTLDLRQICIGKTVVSALLLTGPFSHSRGEV